MEIVLAVLVVGAFALWGVAFIRDVRAAIADNRK